MSVYLDSNQPLQEPGRYLSNDASVRSVATFPQRQTATVPPATGAVVIAVSAHGVKVTTFPSMLASLKLLAATLTVIFPSELVVTVSTYFVPDPEVTSQPQDPPAGSAVEDWIVSVIVVRQADAARITSDILAFFV